MPVDQILKTRTTNDVQGLQAGKSTEMGGEKNFQVFTELCALQEAPSGVVREDTFKHIYSQFFPKGADTNQYAHYVFNTFDPDHTGIVTFTVRPATRG